MNTEVADFIARLALMLPVIIVSLSVHEFAHAITATWCGDSTPMRQGRVTLNPIVHIDFLGLLCLIFFGVGWARPVEFNPDNFKYHKSFSFLTAAAGPISNFILALISMYLIMLFPTSFLPVAFNKTFIQLLQASIWINIGLGVLNFLPIPPLDGGHLMMAFLRERAPHVALWISQYSFYLTIALLLLLPQLSVLIHKLSSVVFNYLTGLVFI